MNLLKVLISCILFYSVNALTVPKFSISKNQVLKVGICSVLLSTSPITSLQFNSIPSVLAAEVSDDKIDDKFGKTEVQGELLKLYTRGLRLQQPGEDLNEAQKVFEELVQVEPNFIYGWTNLGNVLTSLGDLDDAILCYNKAISLKPPSNALAVIALNRASIFMSTGKVKQALQDMDAAERIGGTSSSILTNKAVALSYLGDWPGSTAMFERVINTAERNALPWWLRYSQSLLETNRIAEALPYYQRTLNRFPEETECKAFGVALYQALGSPKEARKYWTSMREDEKKEYNQGSEYLSKQLHWGPRAIAAFQKFQASN